VGLGISHSTVYEASSQVAKDDAIAIQDSIQLYLELWYQDAIKSNYLFEQAGISDSKKAAMEKWLKANEWEFVQTNAKLGQKSLDRFVEKFMEHCLGELDSVELNRVRQLLSQRQAQRFFRCEAFELFSKDPIFSEVGASTRDPQLEKLVSDIRSRLEEKKQQDFESALVRLTSVLPPETLPTVKSQLIYLKALPLLMKVLDERRVQNQALGSSSGINFKMPSHMSDKALSSEDGESLEECLYRELVLSVSVLDSKFFLFDLSQSQSAIISEIRDNGPMVGPLRHEVTEEFRSRFLELTERNDRTGLRRLYEEQRKAKLEIQLRYVESIEKFVLDDSQLGSIRETARFLCRFFDYKMFDAFGLLLIAAEERSKSSQFHDRAFDNAVREIASARKDWYIAIRKAKEEAFGEVMATRSREAQHLFQTRFGVPYDIEFERLEDAPRKQN
jgi:hypothetical protein